VKPRVLIVSPHFPPVNAPDMHRVRVALPFFTAAGWEVTVLTVDDPTPLAPVEPELLATLPPSISIRRVRCLSRRWTGLLGINNVAWRALPFLFLAGCRLLAGRRYDVVYFSTTMFLVLPFGRLWRWRYGVPYVIDLQDPWVSDYYERPGAPPPPGGWKYRLARGMARALEGWTMRRVSHVITVSAAYLTALRGRHAFFKNIPATELPFGSPDPDLDRLRSTLAQRPPLLPHGGFRLAFAGALGPGQFGAVENFCAALVMVRQAGLAVSAHFFGTSYDPAARPAVLDLAARYGLQGVILEQPSRLPYFDALQLTLEADVNLLFGSADLAFTPSKMLGVLAAGRPVLSIAPAGSAMLDRLGKLGQTGIAFSGATADASAINEIAARLQALARHPENSAMPLPAGYRAQGVADHQMHILAGIS
jgi:hypothetical protein